MAISLTLLIHGCPTGITNEANQEESDGILSDATPLLVQPKVEVTHLSLTQSAMTVIVAMKKEKGMVKFFVFCGD